MTLVRPRLNDYHKLEFTQEQVDFAIPFLDEDIPLYLDPFLLWKSPSMQDNAIHTAITNCFNNLGYLVSKGREKEAIDILIGTSECSEVGLGMSKTRTGQRIGVKTAADITSLFKSIPQVGKNGFTHFEEIQMYVDNIAKDRISDIACNFMISFLIDFTIEQAEKYQIPLIPIPSITTYDYKTNKFIEEKNITLPVNPETGQPVILVPKRWLRAIPWISYDDYYSNFYVNAVPAGKGNTPNRISILNYNRQNYDLVQTYIKTKELTQTYCKNDPLFKPIPITSAKSKISLIRALPSGKNDNADKKYEEYVCQLMASILYPEMDFASEQSRTDSGVLIRDLIFYNNRSVDILQDIYKQYNSQQIVMELKNVKAIEREHVNQLNRYLNDQFGNFGILITRNPLPKAIFKNTIDLWSGQRKCIISLTDEDLAMMVNIFEDKHRKPMDVIKKKFIEFMRLCPS